LELEQIGIDAELDLVAPHEGAWIETDRAVKVT
jgi:hypothetical protein